MGTVRSLISMADITLIILGVSMILLGGLIATIYTAVGTMVVTQFQNITNQAVQNYVSTAATYVPMIINMLGLVLIIVAVAHIIVILLGTLKKPAEAAGVTTA